MSRHKRQPPFTLTLILEWADAHHERTGHWPNEHSGPILEAPGESWKKVANALRVGQRGLRGGQSLGKLFTKRRGVKSFRRRPQLNIDQVLNWPDLHCERTGKWPTPISGPVHEAPHVTWHGINQSLRHGTCGLPGGSALAELLVEQRGVRNKKRLPPYHIKQILSWADRHHKQTGEWPTQDSGSIAIAPGETWKAVNSALIQGGRGLSGGSTLARLLAERRAVRNRGSLPKYTLKQILEWARSQHARTGRWPIAESGEIQDAPGETWQAVDMALRKGRRGLKAGSSLSRLLKQKGMVSRRVRAPVLSIEQILAWADVHHQRTGRWPNENSGPILETDGETWIKITTALRKGLRGLNGRTSLARLLADRRGAPHKFQKPRLTKK